MRHDVPVKISSLAIETAERQTLAATVGKFQPAAIRVSPGGYFAALFLLSFLSGFLVYLQITIPALWLLAATWATIPPLAWFDRISFDGENLRRTGVVPRLRQFLTRQPAQLKIAEIEKIETQAVRAMRSGERVYYRYRSEISSKHLIFTFASGGAAFRRIVGGLFPLVAEDKLDERSLELRDYLVEPAALKTKLADLQIPSAEVLESAKPKLGSKKGAGQRRGLQTIRRGLSQMETERGDAVEKVAALRRVANELRLAGNLRQSLEAFRRALLIEPGNGWLLFEFARGLHSYAGTQKDARLVRRAKAALKLSEERAGNNAALLARIGETWFQYDETDRAEKVFRRAAAIETHNFRASNGLAEINLTAGKLAHVIHHFQASARAANDDALRGWASGEAVYFALLNTDDDYLSAELTRINRLHDAQTGGRICLRLSLVGLLAALFGIIAADDLIVQLGLAIAAATAVLWLLLIVAANLLMPRTALEADEQ